MNQGSDLKRRFFALSEGEARQGENFALLRLAFYFLKFGRLFSPCFSKFTINGRALLRLASKNDEVKTKTKDQHFFLRDDSHTPISLNLKRFKTLPHLNKALLLVERGFLSGIFQKDNFLIFDGIFRRYFLISNAEQDLQSLQNPEPKGHKNWEYRKGRWNCGSNN